MSDSHYMFVTYAAVKRPAPPTAAAPTAAVRYNRRNAMVSSFRNVSDDQFENLCCVPLVELQFMYGLAVYLKVKVPWALAT